MGDCGCSVEATMSATRQKSQWQVVTRLGGLCFGMDSWPHHIIPGTQMTLVLIGKACSREMPRETW